MHLVLKVNEGSRPEVTASSEDCIEMISPVTDVGLKI